MSRPLRIEYPGAWYHVMNRGRRKEEIFHDDGDFEIFLKVVDQTSRLFSIEIHAYVLMANHYHLLVHTPKGNLSRAMRHLGGVYTQKLNKKYKIDGSLFRGRFKSILVDKDEYLLELVRYIHRNPYKAGEEEKLGQYKWSSYKGYMDKDKRRDFLITEEVLIRFGKYENEAREKLKAFIKEEVPKDLLKRLESVNWPSVLGGRAFRAKIKEKIRGKEINKREIPAYSQTFEKKNKKHREEIDRILMVTKEALEARKSRKHSLERRAVTYILRKGYGVSLVEIGKYLGNISYTAVSKQYTLAEQEIAAKVECYALVERIKKDLKLQVKI